MRSSRLLCASRSLRPSPDLTESSCFRRWQLARRPECGGERRPCPVPAASARAGSPLSGVWTLPQRKKQKLIPASTRSVRFYSSFQVSQRSIERHEKKISFRFILKLLVLLELRPPNLPFCPSRSLLMEKSQRKSP